MKDWNTAEFIVALLIVLGWILFISIPVLIGGNYP